MKILQKLDTDLYKELFNNGQSGERMSKSVIGAATFWKYLFSFTYMESNNSEVKLWSIASLIATGTLLITAVLVNI